jgi:hypothetical protein
MNSRLIAAMVAAAVLPLAAHAATATVEPRAPAHAPADKAKADDKVTPKERARLAKAQNKQNCKVAGQKGDTQKRKQAPAG